MLSFNRTVSRFDIVSKAAVPHFSMVVLAGLGQSGPEFFAALRDEALRILASIA